ncbi:MAG: glycosyltransferase, partial [Thermoanaerobaculales bacterium]|nr:glycosyltransferase [Thermoanaerobaculales bacterium]
MTNRPLSVVTLSPSERGGGAEMIAWALFNACRQHGHHMKMVVGDHRTNDPDVTALADEPLRSRWARWWLRIAMTSGAERARNFGQPLRWLRRRLGHEDMDFPASRRLLEESPQAVDLVHAHNLHGLGGGFFDLRALPVLGRQAPLMLTLHDSWLFTGHCAHSFDCDRWRTGCGKCPDIGIPEAIRRDASAANWRRKQKIFQRCSLFVVTPSRWLMDRVEKSLMAPAIKEGRVIPNGVDLEVFQPGDPASARKELGLEPEDTIVLCLGNALKSNIWKDFAGGFQAVRAAARRLGKRIVLFAVGESGPQIRETDIDLISIGPLTHASEVAAAMQAA